jgi:nitric oxide reductase NorE protein
LTRTDTAPGREAASGHCLQRRGSRLVLVLALDRVLEIEHHLVDRDRPRLGEPPRLAGRYHQASAASQHRAIIQAVLTLCPHTLTARETRPRECFADNLLVHSVQTCRNMPVMSATVQDKPVAAPDAAEAQPRKRTRHLPGEEGTWVFILGDMTVFGLIFCVYLYYRAQDPALFNRSQELLHQGYGAINTLLLLTSSLCVVTAVRALRHGYRNLAPKLIVVAFVCGLGFCFMKYIEWGDKLSHGIKPATNDFWMYYYVLTGLHFFHLLIGMAVLAAIWTLSRKPALSERQVGYFEGGACFWHMVDLLWIVLFALLYLVH